MKTEYRKSSVHIYKIEGDTACSVLAYSYFEKGETISISYHFRRWKGRNLAQKKSLIMLCISPRI
jgi:hypothetical protein